MTRAKTLRALAERVEKLTGPCRQTDGDIALARGFVPPGLGRGVSAWASGEWFCPLARGRAWSAPRYTASLDVAAGLAPAGWETRLHFDDQRSSCTICLPSGGVGLPRFFGAWAATPALALTAAALRALAEEAGDE